MAKKTVYRNVRTANYTQVSNSFLNDPKASLQAKGLLSIFLSNSFDWEINMSNIISRSKNGRDAHYSAVKELIKLGYFARIQIIGDNNNFEEMLYIFSDIKKDVENEIERLKVWAREKHKKLHIEYKDQEYTISVREKNAIKNPFPENPETENPETGTPDTETPDAESQYINNTNYKNTNVKNTNSKNTTTTNVTNSVLSSSSSQAIDDELKKKYPDVPFEEIKDNLLNDETAVIETEKQYKALLEYRLKNWKPRNKRNQTYTSPKPVRSEKVPDWFEHREFIKSETDDDNEIENIEEERRKLQKRLQKYKQKKAAN